MRIRSLLIVAALVAIILAGVAAMRGLNGFSARSEPSAAERIVARTARHLAIPHDAREAHNPITFSSQVWADSRAHFADHCAVCHANDGSGDTEIGRNLYPKAPDMRLDDTQQ